MPELLCSPPFYAYISADLLAPGVAGDMTALCNHKLIGQMRHTEAWAEYMQIVGLAFSPDMIGGNHSMLTTAAQAVLNGSGIALLPDFIASRHVLAGAMRRVCSTAYRPPHSSYYLTSKKSVRERPIYLAFRKWLADLCGTLN